MEKHAFNLVFGNFIRHFRKQKGWSQVDLASKVGHNFQNVSRLERGEISPTLYWCSEVLAPALGLTFAEFILKLEEFRTTKTFS
ncbi:MAG: helix-turn-helix transcriptional regulator [Cryomorphaceae bacterium]|nr:helix-turn-helix transcriptional regulator [Cryomorphaceae bacterium]